MKNRTNKKSGYCTECGAIVEPGQGSLWWEPGPDDGGDVVGRTPAGWRVTHLDEELCAQEIQTAKENATAERQERARQVAERQEAERLALDAQKEEIDRLLAEIPDCVAAGYDWDSSVIAGSEGEPVSFVSLHVDENPALAGLSLGHSGWERHTAFDGSICYTHCFGNALVLFATREVVERAWANFPNAKHYSSTDWIKAEYSQEALEAWLAKYGPESPRIVEARAKKAAGDDSVASWELQPCAGWECRAYRAGRIDLLKAEGVLK